MKVREDQKSKLGKNASASSSKSSNICQDNNGCAYIVNSETNLAILLATNLPTLPDSSLFSTLTTDSIPEDWFNSMSSSDKFEYHSLFVNDLFASIDWNKRRRSVSTNAYLALPLNSNTHTNISISSGAFILDSGTSVHISPESTDFFDLKPISPRPIKGVGGSFINTTSIGKIHLHLKKGHTLVLDPAHYVPEASVCLISVVVLGTSDQKLTSHFDGKGCWLTNKSGVTVTSGILSTFRKQLYALNMGSPSVEHSYLASCVPDLET